MINTHPRQVLALTVHPKFETLLVNRNRLGDLLETDVPSTGRLAALSAGYALLPGLGHAPH